MVSLEGVGREGTPDDREDRRKMGTGEKDKVRKKGWKPEIDRVRKGIPTDCESMPNQLSIQELERNISVHDSLSVDQPHSQDSICQSSESGVVKVKSPKGRE